MNKFQLLLLPLCLINACTVPVTPEEAKSAVFATEPSFDEAIARITDHIKEIAVDPESVLVECNPALKGWARRDTTGRPQFGWLYLCDINARNRFGGYTGDKRYIFIINGNSFYVVSPEFLRYGFKGKAGVVD
ncbi:MAG: hypothetical protein ACJAVI_003164 [Candidatus Azotimanducaceae bacterium]|jgi:hypothetical protein